MNRADIERLDESLMVTGLGWREAASITNEAVNTRYTIAGRVWHALDQRDPSAVSIFPEVSS
jgi:hypothetical protein